MEPACLVTNSSHFQGEGSRAGGSHSPLKHRPPQELGLQSEIGIIDVFYHWIDPRATLSHPYSNSSFIIYYFLIYTQLIFGLSRRATPAFSLLLHLGPVHFPLSSCSEKGVWSHIFQACIWHSPEKQKKHTGVVSDLGEILTLSQPDSYTFRKTISLHIGVFHCGWVGWLISKKAHTNGSQLYNKSLELRKGVILQGAAPHSILHFNIDDP